MSHLVGVETQPIFRVPRGEPKEWTLTALRQHLQTAVILELYTIPLYLFAMYSIDAPSKPVEGNQEQEAVKDFK
ncbi:hypothetical protein FRC11_003397, partial [Ceratobasidium sp. 423]